MNPGLSKSVAAAILFLAAASMAAGCGSRADMATGALSANTQIRVYEVFGMDCPGCHGGLEKLVDAIPGVAGSQAAWEQKSLTVYVADGADVDDADIGAAIKKANFTPGARLK